MIEGYHHFRKHPFCCCWKLIFWLVVEPTPSEKIWTSNWIISPSKGENEKYVWNQHLVLLSSQIGTIISYISRSPSDCFWEINKHFPKIVLTKKLLRNHQIWRDLTFDHQCRRQWKTRMEELWRDLSNLRQNQKKEHVGNLQRWGICYVPGPRGSMYGIFTSIWWISMVNVGKYTIHGYYGGWYSATVLATYVDLVRLFCSNKPPP